ncbi:hypothetical protein LAZ29_00030, partial [Cereibacter sphaeroides]|uniref:hypothetical protein n=1 Tax=Cereibacter sphaeroides TaxID=1063 RepID=UPI001F2BE1F7
TLTFESFAPVTNQLYTKLSGDSQYRFILKNSGDQTFGDGSAVVDTTLARVGKSRLTVNNGVVAASHFVL